MHDELLERRLGAALRDEAASIPFTITAAELERRSVLRRRSFAGRRLGLLLAAAVGIGLFGVGAALNGWFTSTLPAPTPAVVPTRAPQAATQSAAVLPSLDVLVAPDPTSVIFAEAHGPAAGPAPGGGQTGAALGTVVSPFLGAGHLEVTFACLGAVAATVTLDYRDVTLGTDQQSFSGQPPAPFDDPCDGVAREHTLAVQHPGRLSLTTIGPASWRIAVRLGSDRGTTSKPQGYDVEPREGEQELVRLENATLDGSATHWGSSRLEIQEIGAVPPRDTFAAKLWCGTSQSLRLVFGDSIDGAIVADTEAQVPCDAVIHEVQLAIPRPNGSRVYVAAQAGTRWSALVTSPTPPISLTQHLPGWEISGGIGPDFSFETTPRSFGGAAEGEDHVQVVLSCTGTDPIEVTVEDGTPIGTHKQRFQAACSPDGTTTSQMLTVSEQGVAVSYVAPRGTWTAMSILVPSK